MYKDKQGGFRGKPAAAASLTSAANILNFLAEQSLIVRRLSFQVKTTVVSTGNVVITAYRRPTPGSATGQVVLGTLSIPTTSAAPNVFYKDIQGVLFNPGDEFAFDVTTAAAGGGAAGDGYAILEQVEESPEEAFNISNHVLSV